MPERMQNGRSMRIIKFTLIFERSILFMPILRSYYQDVYRSPVVRLTGIPAATGHPAFWRIWTLAALPEPPKMAWLKRCWLLLPSAALCSPVCRWWKPVPAVLALRCGKLCHHRPPLHSGGAQQPAAFPQPAAAEPGRVLWYAAAAAAVCWITLPRRPPTAITATLPLLCQR